MTKTPFDNSPAEHFTDEQKFRLILPRMARLIDSQLARRSLTSDNCAFEYAHTGRLSNSLGRPVSSKPASGSRTILTHALCSKWLNTCTRTGREGI